jgi:hypothetical protein
VIAFTTTSFFLPFVKIVHSLAIREFDGYNVVNGNPNREEGDIQSITKREVTKIDSVFITFHQNDKSKVI